MAHPIIESTSTYYGTGTGSNTVNYPTGCVAGDLVVVFVRIANGSGIPNATFLSSFTRVFGVGSVTPEKMYAYYRVMTGSEGATFDLALTAPRAIAVVCYRISGHGGEVIGCVLPGTTYTAPKVAAPWGLGDCLALSGIGVINAAAVVTAIPDGYSNSVSITSGVTTGRPNLTVCQSNFTGILESPGTFTVTGDTYPKTFTVLIAPVSVALPPTVVFDDNFGSGTENTDLSTDTDWVKHSGGTDGWLRFTSTGALRAYSDQCYYYSAVAPPHNAQLVEIDITPVTKSDYARVGVLARFDPVTTSGYRGTWARTGTSDASERLQLYRVDAGVSTLLGEFSISISVGATARLSLLIVDNFVALGLNGEYAICVEDASPITAGGAVGIDARNYAVSSSTTGHHLDNFAAYTLDEAPPPERQMPPLFLII